MKSKNERIREFIHKIAQKNGVDYETASKYQIVQEFINYVENDTEITGE